MTGDPHSRRLISAEGVAEKVKHFTLRCSNMVHKKPTFTEAMTVKDHLVKKGACKL
jgi:hypothetical protein